MVSRQPKRQTIGLPKSQPLHLAAPSAAGLEPKAQLHYEQIAKAIGFMRQHYRQQPSLAAVAQHVGFSESYFQRLFSQWAGISPKRFVQYLSVEYAKAQIAETNNLLELSLNAGLSGPGRLHDLFVNLEAMSPGDYKAQGQGLEIRYGLHPTPFGLAMLATTARGICSLFFLGSVGREAQDLQAEDPGTLAAQALRAQWPQAHLRRDDAESASLAQQIFAAIDGAPCRPLTVVVKGTNFQIQVWRALLRLPAGAMATYQTVAKLIERPSATRAVGSAIGRNPVAYLIPCHRVICTSGELGGYRWGCDRKLAMLGWEASQRNNPPGPHG